MYRHSRDGIVFCTSPLLERVGVPHAFSTRIGGVSPAPFGSLNLGIARDSELKDSRANVEENYRRLMSAIGCAGRSRCWLSQVHGREVYAIGPDEDFESGCRGDALVTTDSARVVSVKYADCVPILLASADGRAVAAVHAGWRGVVAGVLGAAVERLAQCDGRDPATLVAAVGPCIAQENFEVGPEVVEAFEALGESRRSDRCEIAGGAGGAVLAPPRSATCEAGWIARRANGKALLDLRPFVRLQLLHAGLRSDRIDVSPLCTYALPEEFFSHRRDGAATGRMAAIIGPGSP